MASKNKKIFNSSHGLVLTFQPGANLKMVLKWFQAGFQIDVDRMTSLAHPFSMDETEFETSVWKHVSEF